MQILFDLTLGLEHIDLGGHDIAMGILETFCHGHCGMTILRKLYYNIICGDSIIMDNNCEMMLNDGIIIQMNTRPQFSFLHNPVLH